MLYYNLIFLDVFRDYFHLNFFLYYSIFYTIKETNYPHLKVITIVFIVAPLHLIVACCYTAYNPFLIIRLSNTKKCSS